MAETSASPRRHRPSSYPVGRVLLAGGLLAGGTAVLARRVLAPPARPPAYDGARPEPTWRHRLDLAHSIMINAAPAEVHGWMNDPVRDINTIIRPGHRFPDVAGAEILVGEWQSGARSGERRRVRYTDGHYFAQEVLVDTPRRFRYQIWGFTKPDQRLGVRCAVGEFGYRTVGARTRMTWDYSFEPRAAVLRPFVGYYLRTAVSPMIMATLAGIRVGVEDGISAR